MGRPGDPPVLTENGPEDGLHRLQAILAEMTRNENGSDGLHKQHQEAVERLAETGLKPASDIKLYQDRAETDLEEICWSVGRSTLSASPVLVTKVLEEGGHSTRSYPIGGPFDCIEHTVPIEHAKDARMRILHQAFTQLWQELNFTDVLAVGWYWVVEAVHLLERGETDSARGRGHLRVPVLVRRFGESTVYSYIKFNDA